MPIRRISTVLCATALAALAACSTVPRDDPYANAPVRPAPPVYTQNPAYQQPPVYSASPAYAQYGTVGSIDVMPVASRTSGGGAILGAVLGAVVGNQIGSGTGRAAATVAGAVGGGYAGNAIERRTRGDNEVFHVDVRFDDGSRRQFDFKRIDDLRVGDRVRWDGGQLQRL